MRDRCQGKPQGSSCWKELANHTECYVWDGFDTRANKVATKSNRLLDREQKVTWTGGCSDGVASGTGTLKWDGPLGYMEHESMGTLLDGKASGHWILRKRGVDIFSGYEIVEEGPYKDGKANGHWISRHRETNLEKIEEGPLVTV